MKTQKTVGELLDIEHARKKRKKAIAAWHVKHNEAEHAFLDACNLAKRPASDDDLNEWETAYKKENPYP